ncbi:TetR/AcrR family transcriptional regulator [Nocardia brasiliensis]|uniref:TetR family transcriptional regulator n=1 Tax=Nocardia brasiliensis (strain ATCC 700358 / HUJEG-1) TaxID=1133849 RepID=K0EUC2_NOCB7|nr:TetR family transcriptional regulator [Nocardia brasiliensis]AFU00485.1 TetR family transcriptional regulator [Nocardia brasiliensis ATCC 700358]OCF83786.1 TetR family transcriptional regulator [Nocardia brasiliensis]
MSERQAVQRRRGRGGRERIIAAATALFEAQGLNATSMEQVAAAAPVSKRTLYQHFPTKDDLALSYLRHLVESGRTIDAVLDRDDLPPRDRLLALFALPDAVDAPIRGCPFIDAAAEFPDPHSPAHRYAATQKRRMATRLTELVAALGVTDPRTLGEQLALLADGAASRSMVLNDTGCYDYARAAARALLDAATPAENGSPRH